MIRRLQLSLVGVSSTSTNIFHAISPRDLLPKIMSLFGLTCRAVLLLAADRQFDQPTRRWWRRRRRRRLRLVRRLTRVALDDDFRIAIDVTFGAVLHAERVRMSFIVQNARRTYFVDHCASALSKEELRRSRQGRVQRCRRRRRVDDASVFEAVNLNFVHVTSLIFLKKLFTCLPLKTFTILFSWPNKKLRPSILLF